VNSKLGRNDPCWCGSGTKYKKCHLPADRAAGRTPDSDAGATGAAGSSAPSGLTSLFRGKSSRPPTRPRRKPREIRIKTADEIEGIRRACQLTRSILDDLSGVVAPGVPTGEIDRFVHDRITGAGATPATLGYNGYPASSCISINEVVCHGIPDARELAAGHIVNIDVTSVLDGYYGDASRMYLVGEVSDDARRLVEVTRESLDRGIEAVRPGAHVGDIGHAIQSYAEGHGFSVVRQMVGHGVGLEFHEAPEIPHFGRPGDGPELAPGMVFTIEPMINAGGWRLKILDDDWTAVTVDGSLSAQWEHTVAVTADGVDVLTA
jgi:methionyl aminopeptidase